MKQKILIGIGIFACLSAVGFSFHGQQANWFWGNAPYIALLLMLLAFGSAKIWHDIEQKRQAQKMRDILQAVEKNRESSKDALTKLLTERERIVLDKILEGKHNKQIADWCRSPFIFLMAIPCSWFWERISGLHSLVGQLRFWHSCNTNRL